MSSPPEDWFQLTLPAQPDLKNWIENNVQETEDPGRYDGNSEQRYEIELRDDGTLFLYGAGGDSPYQSVTYSELIRKYLETYSPTTLMQVPISVTVEDGAASDYLYLITATGSRAIAVHDVEVATRVKHFRRLFREKCCVACEQDVLSEGGRHDNDCPLGKIFGMEGEIWRPVLGDT